MRFDRLIQLITLADIEDGLGGHTETEQVIGNRMANIEELSLETTVKVYGDAYHQNVKVNILGASPKIDIINIDNVKYKVVSQRKIKNKTSFFLEVLND